MTNENIRDSIYQQPQTPSEFVFDERVAHVFGDMISRSVPGYATTISTIGELAAKFVTDNSRCYDLGCSLGAATFTMQQTIQANNSHIIGVDLSEPMLDRCNAHLASQENSTHTQVTFQQADIRTTPIHDASMVVLNFTLQFVPVEDRASLIETIYAGLNSGGIVVISEKVRFPDPALDALNIDLHHRFKQTNGYSDLEIAQKRSALENVLIPETIDEHRERLQNAGFARTDVWLQCFNFVSMVAIK